MDLCINCGKAVSGFYCSNCGQKIRQERITFHHIWHGLVHFFTHAEEGFFYTTKQMIISPGVAVKGFIEGKRKNHQTPVSYFLIWNAAYILLLYIIGKIAGENKVVNFSEYFGPAEKTRFAISHLNIILFFLLPFQALYLYLVLMRKLYNYFESLVVVFYSIGTLLFWQIIFVLLAIPVFLLTGYSIHIQWSDIFKFLYVGWFIIDFVNLLPVRQKVLRIIMVMLLVLGTFTAWRLYVYPSVAELFF